MTWHDSYSPYCKWDGQCVGRILHFIYHYCGPHIAEHVQVGYTSPDFKQLIKYGNTPIATYEWDGDIPRFNFFPPGWDFGTYPERNRNDWAKAQSDLVAEVAYPLEYRRTLADKLRKFKSDFELIQGLTILMDSGQATPAPALVEKWVKLANGLPIKELCDYIFSAKLYDAIKGGVTE